MKESKLSIKYRVGNVVYEENDYQTQHYYIEATYSESGARLVLNPREKLELISFKLDYLHPVKNGERFYANGYQSWSTSEEYTQDDRQKGVAPVTRICGFTKMLASTPGDYSFEHYSGRPGVFHGYTYAYFRREQEVELYGSVNERTGFTIFRTDMQNGTFSIAKDVEGVVVTSPYVLLDIVKEVGDYDAVFDAYFARFGIPKPRIDHMAGYTSWYNYFQKIDEDIILRDLKGIARANSSVSVFQVDDGYETKVGDWLESNPKFPHGMKYIADAIHEQGYLAGIWIAPLNAQRDAKIVAEHPDWFIKGANGKPVISVVGWGGAYTLDIYNEEARAYIVKVFDTVLNEWGFDMVKLDFLYSQCMFPRFGKSRGQLMAEAMDFLRELVGDKLFLGCGVPLGSAFGVVDACRISCDVDLKYKGKIYDRVHINREVPSAQNAIRSTIFRRHLDGRAFVNDPDVFFLRDFNLKFTDKQKQLLAKINHLFGNVLFVSDDVGKYGDAELSILLRAFEKSNAMIISAEFTDKDYITVKYLDGGERKTLAFDLRTGETSSALY